MRLVIIWLIFVSIFFFHALKTNSDATVYLVAAHQTDCLNIPTCVEFSTFLQYPQIESNTILYFYPGIYEIQINRTFYVTLENLSNVTIATVDSNQRAQIYCNGGFKLVWIFVSSSNILFQGIEMIECSAPLHYIIDDLSLSFIINSKTTVTVLIAKVVTISLNDIYLSDSNEVVLLSYNVVGCLRIASSTFKGAIHTLYQSLVQEIEDTGIKIEVRDSEFFAREKDLSQTGGIIFDTPESTIEIFFIIERSSFNGIKKTYGFLLSVHFGHCSLLELLLMNVTFNQSGVSITSSDLNSSLQQSVNISMQNSLFINMFSRSGLEIAGLVGTTHNNQVTVNVSNSKFSSSDRGLSITYATAYLENLTFEESMAALRLSRSIAYFKGTNMFSKNYGKQQRFAAILINAKSQVYVEGKLLVIANSERKYSAVIVRASNLFINGSVHFSENRGFYGGALSLYFESILTLLPEGSITFIKNHALSSGGAIYIETERYCLFKVQLAVQCFYRFKGITSKQRLHFCNNTSVQGGDSIFGGSVDDCSMAMRKLILILIRISNSVMKTTVLHLYLQILSASVFVGRI